MNEDQKAAAEALLSKIKSADPAGVHGSFIAELKDLAKAFRVASGDELEPEAEPVKTKW